MQSKSPSSQSPTDHDQMKVDTTKGNAKRRKGSKKVVVRSGIRTKIRRASILHASQEQPSPTAPTAAIIEPQKKAVVLVAEEPTQEEEETKVKQLDRKPVTTCTKKAAQQAPKNAAHADATNASTAAIDTMIDSDPSSTSGEKADANLEKTMQQTHIRYRFRQGVQRVV